jgi:hypothetical protein
LNVGCHRTKYGEAKDNYHLGAGEKLDIAGSKETALVRPSVSLRLIGHVLEVAGPLTSPYSNDEYTVGWILTVLGPRHNRRLYTEQSPNWSRKLNAKEPFNE